MIKYGLISEIDARCLEKTIDLIIPEFWDEKLCVTEIGLYNCETSVAIKKYIDRVEMEVYYTGIDNNKEIVAPDWMNLIIGNSNEVYNQLEDNSQHLIFIDGNHSFPYVISDFFCYAGKVKQGGYLAFHDTGEHIKPFKDYQGVGSKADADMYISVRKALDKIGLFNRWAGGSIGGEMVDHIGCKGFDLIFDVADENNEAGGVCVFKKLY
jgi:hypothetical protein